MFKKIISGILGVAIGSSMIATADYNQQVDSIRKKNVDSEFELNGSNSLGNYISQLSYQKNISTPENTILTNYSIGSVDFDKEKGILYLHTFTDSDCNAEVTFFAEETNKAVLKRKFKIKSGKFVDSEFDINTALLPEYFYIKVRLVDNIGTVLSKEYSVNDYKKSMQELNNSDIYDFEDSVVINLDEKTDTNFVVLSDDTVYAESSEEQNTLISADYDNNVFEFANADDTVNSLINGEYFFIQPTEHDVIAVSVDSVENKDGITIVKGNSENIDDMFDCMKIEATQVGSTMTVDTSGLDDSLLIEGHEDDEIFVTSAEEMIPIYYSGPNVNADYKQTFSYTDNLFPAKKEVGNFSIENNSNISITFSIEISKFFGDIELSAKLTPEINLGFEFGLNWNNPTKRFPMNIKDMDFFTEESRDKVTDTYKELAKNIFTNIFDIAHISISTPIPGLIVEFDPKLEFTIKGELKIGCHVKSEYVYSYADGVGNFEANGDIIDPSFELAGSVSLGIKFGPKIQAINDKIASIGAEAKAEFSISTKDDISELTERYGEASKHFTMAISGDSDHKDSKHGCFFCMPFSFDFNLSLSGNMKILGHEIKVTVAECKFHILDLHFSSHNKLKLGKCDFNKYRVGFNVCNVSTEEMINGAEILVTYGDEKITVYTNADGYAEVYCDPGSYTYTVKYNDSYYKEAKFEIIDSSLDLYAPYETEITEDKETIVRFKDVTTSTGVKHTTTTYTTTRNTQTLTTKAVKSNIVEGGKLGDNITFVLYDDGTLWIYGYGEMYDFEAEKQPFDRKNVKKVIFEVENYNIEPIYDEDGNITDYKYTDLINDGIHEFKNIGSDVFRYCYNLEEIYYYKYDGSINDFVQLKGIPDTITDFGHHCFAECSLLKFGDINFSLSDTDIGYSAFEYCNGITNLTFSGNNIMIDDFAFRSCEGINDININGHVSSIGVGAFKENSIKNLEISGIVDGINESTAGSFERCNNLEKINISGKVGSLGNRTFNNCDSLECLTVTGEVDYIGKKVFESCKSLTSAELSGNIKEIGGMLFPSCELLNTIILPYPGVAEDNFQSGIDTVIGYSDTNANVLIPSLDKVIITGGTTINSYTFKDFFGTKDKYIHVYLPDTITEIEGIENISKNYIVIHGLKDSYLEKYMLENAETLEERNCILYETASPEDYKISDGNESIITTIATTTTVYTTSTTTSTTKTSTTTLKSTTVSKATTTSQTTVTSKSTAAPKTTTTTAQEFSKIPGDANGNGEIDMSDAVLILQMLANPGKYGVGGTSENAITKEGLLNCDVYQKGSGVTAADALSIQKYCLKLIESLPES